MVNYGRVQFVSIELGISPITLIHNMLHAWKCFPVAPRKRELHKSSLFLYCHLVVDMPSFEFYKFYVQLYAIWRGVLYIFVNFVVWIVEIS